MCSARIAIGLLERPTSRASDSADTFRNRLGYAKLSQSPWILRLGHRTCGHAGYAIQCLTDFLVARTNRQTDFPVSGFFFCQILCIRQMQKDKVGIRNNAKQTPKKQLVFKLFLSLSACCRSLHFLPPPFHLTWKLTLRRPPPLPSLLYRIRGRRGFKLRTRFWPNLQPPPPLFFRS